MYCAMVFVLESFQLQTWVALLMRPEVYVGMEEEVEPEQVENRW